MQFSTFYLLLHMLGSVLSARTLSSSSSSSNEISEPVAESLDCSKNRMQKCWLLLQKINKDHNLAFACTEGELNTMCNTIKGGLDCVYSFATRCLRDKEREVIYDLLRGTEEIMRLICLPGVFRKEYLIYAPCMKNVSTDPKMCGRHYQQLIHSVTPQDDVSAADTIRRQCCAFHSYLLCVTEVSETECGKTASDFIKDYSYRTAGALIKNQCKNYMAGSLMCSLSLTGGATTIDFKFKTQTIHFLAVALFVINLRLIQ